MLKEEQGIKAIIELQKMMGIKETEEQAKAGWAAMSEADKAMTEKVYKDMFNKSPDEVE